MTRTAGSASRAPVPGLWRRAESLAVLGLTLALAVLYLAARDAGPFQALEGETLDWRFRLRGPEAVGGEVGIVAIDDPTLAALGRWPFSRTWLAAAVDALAADGARAIVFDLLLVGPEAGDAPEAGSPAAATDADRALAAAMARAGTVVVPFAFVYDAVQANVADLPDAIRMAAYRVVRSGADRHLDPAPHPAGILAPLGAFLAAARPAHVTVFVEADGSLRFSHPAIGYGDSYYPSLAVEGARAFLGVDRDSVTLNLGADLAIGDRRFAIGPQMALAIDYAGPTGTFRTWSLIDVAEGRFAPGTFRDRLVLIGPTAAGLGDRFETPYSAMLPGVEIFANIIDDLLGRGVLRRSSDVLWFDLLAIALAGLLVAGSAGLRRPVVAMLAAACLLGLWSGVSLYAFVAHRLWLNYSFPSLAIVLGATIVVAGLAARESGQRRAAERHGATLTRYVSPLAVARLQDPAGAAAADRTQMAAVLFTDLVGFTQASEKMAPAATAELLRRFHDCVERAALAHGGVVDKFIGDAALVVFGIAGAGPPEAANAIRCARRIAGEVAGWAAQRQTAGRPALACGVGIDFGPVSVAEVGGSVHAQITVTGDTVNVASRLEALTREWRTTIIVSDAALEAARAAGADTALQGFEGLPLQRVRGRDRPIGLWAWPAPARD